MEPGYPVGPVLAFLAFLAVSIPLPWHWEAANASTVGYMIWAALGAINTFVNMVVWHNNARNPAPIWCDIATKFQIGYPVGIAAASLAINRRLRKITSVGAVMQTRKDRRNDMTIDLLLVVGAPFLVMVAQVAVQGHLGYIYEDFGCYQSTVNTLASIFLVTIWPILFSLASGVYCILILHSFAVRRAEFDAFITSNNTITLDRYWRLMMLACMDLLVTFPLSLYAVVSNIKYGLLPYRNWEHIHSHFQRWSQRPRFLFESNTQLMTWLRIQTYLPIICGMMFFIFFGLAEESRKRYKALWWRIMKRFGVNPPTPPNTFAGANGRLQSLNIVSIGGENGLPMFVNQETRKPGRPGSFISSIADISVNDIDSSSRADSTEKVESPQAAETSSKAEDGIVRVSAEVAVLPVLAQTTTFVHVEPAPQQDSRALSTDGRASQG